MKLLSFLLCLSSVFAQNAISVIPVNMNATTLGMLQAMGLAPSNAQPNVQVMIFQDPPVADGYRVSLSCTREDGSAYFAEADVAAVPAGTLHVFSVNCANPVDATAIPYQLKGPSAKQRR